MPNNLPSEIDRYVKAAQELREETEKAHKALRDLRSERKAFAEERSKAIEASLEEIKAHLEKEFDAFTNALPDTLKKVEESVFRRFDQIMMICLGEDPESVRRGQATVTELVKDFVASKKLPIRIEDEAHIIISYESARMERKLGRDLSGLPVSYDSRVPRGKLYIFVPPLKLDERAKVIEVDIESGDGAKLAAAEIVNYERNRVPVAFRKQKKKSGEDRDR